METLAGNHIDTAFFRRCIRRLEVALSETEAYGGTTDVLYDMDRDNRINTEHNDGEGFPKTTLKLLPVFIEDAKALADILERPNDG